MADSDDDAVGVFHVLKGDQIHAVLVSGNLRVGPGVGDLRDDLILFQSLDDVVDLAVAGVGTVFLEGDAENVDLRVLRRFPGLDHLLDGRVRHEGAHAVVHLSAVEDDLAVIAKFLSHIRQIVRIHADAVAAHQTGLEAQRVPLGVHARQHLVRVDAHAVADHGDLVHESNVDVALAVLHDLDGLRRLDAGDREGASLDDDIVDLLDLRSGLLVHTGDDLADVCQRVDPVARVDALRAVADLEVNTAFQPRLFLQDRDADILRHAGVNRGFIDDDRAGNHVAAYDAGRIFHRLQIGIIVVLDRSGNGHDDELCLAQALLVAGEIHRRLADDFVSHLVCRVDAALVLLDPPFVMVKSDDLHMLGKLHRDRHSHIAQTYQSQFFLAADQSLVQIVEFHCVHSLFLLFLAWQCFYRSSSTLLLFFLYCLPQDAQTARFSSKCSG